MKVYKVSCHHPDIGCQVAWVASRQEATRVELHNIPTTRAGLLHWLNTWVDTDNG